MAGSDRAGIADEPVSQAREYSRDSLEPLLEQLAKPPDATLLPSGRMLGRYRIVSLLGKGGMGEVYCAHDARLGRDVAVKVVRAGAHAEPQAQRRFETEAMVVGSLNHPNVMAVFDAGEHDGCPYLVTELLEGETLAQRLRKGPLAPRAAVEVAIAVARALSAAHARGVVHRDLKPANIFVIADGRIKVIDFGIAKWTGPGPRDAENTDTGAVAGTPGYMSPEQARGEPADARSDLFSLGAVLYEMLCGREAFRRGFALEELDAILPGVLPGRAAPGRAIPRELQGLVHRCLAKRPEDRFQSAQELLAKLERVLQDVFLENARSRARTRALLAGAALAALAAVAWLTAAPTDLARVIATEVGRRLRTSGSPAAIRSLVILPIADASAGHEGPSFGDTLTEALTTDLRRTKGLRVVARDRAVRSPSKAPAEIGRDLKVDALLQGTVQRAADRIRVELRLVSTASGEPVWTERFEESATGMLALQARVSRGFRSALVLRLDGEPGLVPQRMVRNPESYDLYLRAKIRARQENEPDVSAAIGLLEKAVSLDPEFAAAQAELSHVYGLRVAQFAPNDAVALERAELAAEKALRLDPDLAESHYAAGQLLWGVVKNRFWADRAVREFKRAIALNPNLDEVHHHLGQVYLHIGLLDQALAEFEKTLDLQPADNNAIRRIGIVLIYRGQYEEGLRKFQQVPAQSNSSLWHYQVAWALLYLGKDQEAWALMEQYLRAHPEDRGGVVTSTRAIWFAKAGDAHRAEEDIRTAVDKGKGFIHFHHSAYNIASAYALLGQAGPAVRWLRTAAETGWPCYPYFANDPNLERIHGDPGYETFMLELKAQWERYKLTL